MARLTRGEQEREGLLSCRKTGSEFIGVGAITDSGLGESIACGGGSNRGIADWFCGVGRWVYIGGCRRVDVC